MKLGWLILAAAWVFAGCAPKSPLHVPMVPRPTDAPETRGVTSVRPSVRVYVAQMSDERDEQTIGVNEESPGKPKAVYPNGSPTEFVRKMLVNELSAAGYQLVPFRDEATCVISPRLKRFFVRETDTYIAEVRVVVRVVNDQGEERWQGGASGGRRRFGRSYSAENYQEVLSDATLELVRKLVSSPELRAALDE